MTTLEAVVFALVRSIDGVIDIWGRRSKTSTSYIPFHQAHRYLVMNERDTRPRGGLVPQIEGWPPWMNQGARRC